MFFATAIFFAVTTFHFSEEIEDDELALAEQTVVIDQNDEIEDGELIFDSEEVVAELEDENSL